MWRPLIAVAGTSEPTDYQSKAAFTVGQLIAQRKGVVVCGGLGGIMDAAARGAAGVDGGISVGLLPELDIAASSPAITIPITTGLGQVRNVVLACACRSMIAIGGGYGTLTEIGFALRLQKPLALIDSWEFNHEFMPTSPHRIFVTAGLSATERAADEIAREAHAVKSAKDAVDWVFDQLD